MEVFGDFERILKRKTKTVSAPPPKKKPGPSKGLAPIRLVGAFPSKSYPLSAKLHCKEGTANKSVRTYRSRNLKNGAYQIVAEGGGC